MERRRKKEASLRGVGRAMNGKKEQRDILILERQELKAGRHRKIIL